MRPLETLTRDALATLIRNHVRAEQAGAPLCAAAEAELARRDSADLDLGRTIELLRQAARQGRCVSYADVARASGREDWARIRYAVPRHLDRLAAHCRLRQWPMLCALVVAKENVASRRMTDGAREGFLRCAHVHGASLADGDAFIAAEQQRCFEWAGALCPEAA